MKTKNKYALSIRTQYGEVVNSEGSLKKCLKMLTYFIESRGWNIKVDLIKAETGEVVFCNQLH